MLHELVSAPTLRDDHHLILAPVMYTGVTQSIRTLKRRVLELARSPLLCATTLCWLHEQHTCLMKTARTLACLVYICEAEGNMLACACER